MKRTAILVSVIFFAALAKGAEPAPSDQQLISMIKEIQTQQAQITDNQSKIDTKIAALAEALRVARIYSSRSGR